MLLMLFLVALFITGLVFWTMAQIKKGKAMGAKFAPPPASVTTVIVEPQTWQPVISAVGSLRAVNGVTLSTDLAGIISDISFESGTPVKKGDLLVKLDTKQEDAQLKSTEAKLSLARIALERNRDLVAKKAIAQSEWDTAESELRQTQAHVEEMRALVARKQIIAPFDGVIGIRMVNVGQYLQPGAAIVPLQSMDPIYVEFALPQHHLATVAVGGKVRLGKGGVGGEGFQGEITAIDSKVDENTRNVTIQATLLNPEHKLRPGMFVDVEVLLAETPGVLTVPSSAIAYAPYGDTIYVVKDAPGADGTPGKQVQQQFIKLGPKRGDQVSIVSGLNAGDEVVSSGVFKLRPNAPVKVNNSVQPGNELNPKPANS